MNAKDFRVWWAGTEKGWIVDTEFGISDSSMRRIREYVLTVQKQRLSGLVPGTTRDECLDTIKALEMGKLTQNIVGGGDHVLYDAYKSTKVMVEV